LDVFGTHGGLKDLLHAEGMDGVSGRHPSQQLFFTRLDEKFMPALATGLTFLVD
jgi:hypothetical protein